MRDVANTPDGAPFDVLIVSPELPCGVSWLANALLELGVAVWSPWHFDTRAEWLALGDGRFRYVAAHRPWRQTLPALQVGREFRFAAAPRPRFVHEWPGRVETLPTLLFVRDPRDALYSEWQRRRRNGGPQGELPFEAFALAPYHHFPFANADYPLHFLRDWLAVLDRRVASDPAAVLVVRYEDSKRDAVGTLQRALDWLRVEVGTEAIECAVERSDYAVFAAVERAMEREGALARVFNRRGWPDEHRETYTGSMRAAIGARYDELLDQLGYTRDGIAAAAHIRA